MALHRFFFPVGAISATKAPVVAISAPMPRPVTNRKIPNVVVVLVNAVMAMPRENHAYAVSMTRRRPTMSPTAPASSAPNNIPNRA